MAKDGQTTNMPLLPMLHRIAWAYAGNEDERDAILAIVAEELSHEVDWEQEDLLQAMQALDRLREACHRIWPEFPARRPDGGIYALCGISIDISERLAAEGALRQAGFDVRVIPNQGAGAAMSRIEATRRLFPRIWFNEQTTEAGRDALGAYHEKRDDKRGIGLGPNHDWASHSADAFGLGCVAYEEPRGQPARPRPARQGGATAWMGG
jgi:hypothetical protein